ncbi:MAG: restriction endonuclease, SacI family [Planctomycetes bacterium]|nr:restriction endonuclease, SacI family [Planctomycetota bacterium]
MPISIDHRRALQVLRKEAELASAGLLDAVAQEWKDRTDVLGAHCPHRRSATFIASLGTALLAKSVDERVDAYSLLDREGGDRAYSARSLADDVMARHRAELGIDLGANGPNPFNNTPFIGKASIREIVTAKNRKGLRFFKECIELVDPMSSKEARSALRGFILSRTKELIPQVELSPESGNRLTPRGLLAAISDFVNADSEQGRRAEACAAGLLDALHSPEKVAVCSIYDPDRKQPGDISIRGAEGSFIRMFQVRDKPVTHSDVVSTVEKVVSQFGLCDISILALSRSQEQTDFSKTEEWAKHKGVKLTVLTRWDSLFGAVRLLAMLTNDFEGIVYRSILRRCMQLEVSAKGIDLWKSYSAQA